MDEAAEGLLHLSLFDPHRADLYDFVCLGIQTRCLQVNADIRLHSNCCFFHLSPRPDTIRAPLSQVKKHNIQEKYNTESIHISPMQ